MEMSKGQRKLFEIERSSREGVRDRESPLYKLKFGNKTNFEMGNSLLESNFNL